MRRLLPLLLLAIAASASPAFPPFNPGPLFQPQGAIVTINLGGGLFWQGPAISQQEWDQRMAFLPTPAPFFPIGTPLIEPQLLRLQPANPPALATPEPATSATVALGLFAAALLLRRRALPR
jgi:hypothetical protein